MSRNYQNHPELYPDVAAQDPDVHYLKTNMTEQNIARIDLVILANQLDDGKQIFHSGTASGYYLVDKRERMTIDMPLEQLFAHCINNYLANPND